MDWQSWDVTEFVGKQATLEIVDAHSGGWGHINVDHIFQSNRTMPSSLPDASRSAATSVPPITGTDPLLLELGQMDPAHRTFASYRDVGFNQKLRPQFHFKLAQELDQRSQRDGFLRWGVAPLLSARRAERESWPQVVGARGEQ